MRNYIRSYLCTGALLIWHSGFAMESLERSSFAKIVSQSSPASADKQKQQKKEEIALRKKVAEFNVPCPVTQETLLPEELQLSIASSMIGDFLDDTADELRESLQVGDAALGKLYLAEISHNGKQLVTVHEPQDDIAYIWSMETAQLLHTLNDHDESITSVTISPNDEQVIIGVANGAIKIWDMTTGTLKHTLYVSTGYIALVVAAPDSSSLITISESEERRVCHFIQIWNMETGDLLRMLAPEEDHCIDSVVITSDCKQFVTNSCTCLRLWNMETGKFMRILSERSCVKPIIIADDTYVIGGCDKQITLCNLKMDQYCVAQIHEARIQALFLSSDKTKLITMAYDGAIKIWDMTDFTQERLSLLHTFESGNIVCIPGLYAFDGYSKKFLKPLSDKSVRVCDIETGKSCYLQGHKDEVGILKINFAGTHIVTGSSAKVAKDTTTKIWSLKKSPARLWLENDILPFQANLVARIYAANKISKTFDIHADAYDRWIWVSFPKHVRDYLNLYLQVALCP